MRIRDWSSDVCSSDLKERRPRDISFRFLCDRIKAIFDMNVWANITRMQESVRYESFRNKGVAREKIVVAYEDMVAGRMTDLESYLGVTLPSDMSSVNLGPFGYTKRSGASGNWRAFFTYEDVKILRPLIGAKLDEIGRASGRERVCQYG